MTEYFYFWLKYHFNIRISYFNFILCPGLLFWFLWYLHKLFTLSKFYKAITISMLCSVYFIWFQSLNVELHLFATPFPIYFWHHLQPSEKKKKGSVHHITVANNTLRTLHWQERMVLCQLCPNHFFGPVSSTYLWGPTCRVQRVLCETEWALVVVGHWCGEK